MGILVTSDLELLIHRLLVEAPKEDSAEFIACELNNIGLVSVPSDDFLLLISLIEKKLQEPCHHKNTPEQEIWRKARRISHVLLEEKRYRDGAFIMPYGAIHTTRGSHPTGTSIKRS